jgi:N-acetylmuramoyl-L-alanine amidase
VKRFFVIIILLFFIISLKEVMAESFTRVVSVTYNKKDTGGEVVIKATDVIKYKSELLSNPPRIAIDIPNVVLALNSDINISSELIKSVKAAQFSTKPYVVRVVVELNKPTSVKIASRILLDEVRLKVGYTNENVASFEATPVPQPQNLNNVVTQQISGIKFEKKDNGVRKISITTTGPVMYEWHRLKSPDNRFYIDISSALLQEKKLTVPVQDDLISDIRAGQFQKSPDVVRIVFKLAYPVDMKVLVSPSTANQLVIEISETPVDESFVAMNGVGSTGYLFKSNNIIVIDPGHGGGDYGAINPKSNLAEKDVNLAIALRLQELLSQAGWNAILTHSTDQDVTSPDSSNAEELGARVNIANQQNACLFISIHCDASSNQDVKGTTTFYYKDKDKPLAMILQQSLISALGTLNRGVKNAKFYVLKNTTMPSALIEVAFISSPDDSKLLSDSAFREKVAKAIYKGVLQYVGNPVVVGEK